MKPVALIVEDKIPSAKTRARLFTALGMLVVTAQSRREAEQKFNYLPNVDLIICDYNLNDEDQDDDGGVQFAQSLRRAGFDGPMVLYSGRDNVDVLKRVAMPDDDGRAMVSEIAPFNDAAQKARMPAGKKEEWLRWALAHLQARMDGDVAAGIEIALKYPMAGLDLTKLVELVPGVNLEIASGKEPDTLAFATGEFESHARRNQFKAVLLGAGLLKPDGESPSLSRPLMVWIKTNGGAVFAEAMGCSEISSAGGSEEEALAALIGRMHDIGATEGVPRHLKEFVADYLS